MKTSNIKWFFSSWNIFVCLLFLIQQILFRGTLGGHTDRQTYISRYMWIMSNLSCLLALSVIFYEIIHLRPFKIAVISSQVRVRVCMRIQCIRSYYLVQKNLKNVLNLNSNWQIQSRYTCIYFVWQDVRKRSCVSYKGSSSVIKFVKTLGNYGKLFAIQIIGMQ